jgi:2-haloacid dehalogenase
MIKNVIFDVGEVLVDWNPRYLYRNLMSSEEEIEKFLAEVCTHDWNLSLDKGRAWDDARAEVVGKFPEYESMIDAYWERWLEMFEGPVHESVDILMDIKRRGFPVYALTNFNDVKWQVALNEFPYLRLFDGRIVSGEVRLAKPDPKIYQILLDTYHLNPRECLFIDDRAENVQGARNVGIEAVLFTTPRQLEHDLMQYGIIEGANEIEETEFKGCGGGCTCHGQ